MNALRPPPGLSPTDRLVSCHLRPIASRLRTGLPPRPTPHPPKMAPGSGSTPTGTSPDCLSCISW